MHQQQQMAAYLKQIKLFFKRPALISVECKRNHLKVNSISISFDVFTVVVVQIVVLWTVTRYSLVDGYQLTGRIDRLNFQGRP